LCLVGISSEENEQIIREGFDQVAMATKDWEAATISTATATTYTTTSTTKKQNKTAQDNTMLGGTYC